MADPDFRACSTDRLILNRPTAADAEELFALNSDARVWAHLPQGRHTALSQTAEVIDAASAGWAANGLDYWCIRLASDGPESPVVGIGGCSVRHDAAWNLYYRLSPEVHGHGYAQELIAAAISAAADTRPELPVIAYLLEHNTGSRRAAERAGFELAWSGPDAGNPDPSARRLIYANQALDAPTLDAFTR